MEKVMVANPQYDDTRRSMKPQHNAKRETIMKEIHGIPMTEEAFESLISVESPYRYELIDSLLYDMTRSTPEHTDLTFNVTALFKDQLGKGGPCRAYHDQYVFIPDRPSVIPDVVVTCDVADRDKDKRL